VLDTYFNLSSVVQVNYKDSSLSRGFMFQFLILSCVGKGVDKFHPDQTSFHPMKLLSSISIYNFSFGHFLYSWSSEKFKKIEFQNMITSNRIC
jgi:hypothetical protein